MTFSLFRAFALRKLGLVPEMPPATDDAALETIHTRAYLDFLRTAHLNFLQQMRNPMARDSEQAVIDV